MYATEELHDFYRDIESLEVQDTRNYDFFEEIDKDPSLTPLKVVNEVNAVFKKFLKNQEKLFCPRSLFAVICKSKAGFRNMEQQDAQ